jgi:hypothetical protein
MRRTLLALGLTGVLAVAGCGISGGAATPSDIADEAIALQQVGFDTGLADAGTPSPGASAGPAAATGDAPARKALRKYLRKNTLHGEVTLQTKKQGTKTVVVQRGAVTSVTAGEVTVKSTDGFTLTWAFGDKLRIVQDKKTVEKSALKTGEEIGIAGAKDGSTNNARLIAIR